jgi:hypothetical protein
LLFIWKSGFNNHFLYFITKTNCLIRYILANIIIVLLFPIAAICRSTWRKEVIIYILHSFKCYLHENLDLIIIFFTLLQKKYLKRYILANIIIVLLFPIAAICRLTWRKEVIIYILHSFKCYLHENLDLIIISFTFLQFFLFKTMYFSKYYHLLFDFSDIFVFLVYK